MSNSPDPVIDLLLAEEAKLVETIDGMRNALAPQERRLFQVASALAALGVKAGRTPEGVKNKTIQQQVVEALRNAFPGGATVAELSAFFSKIMMRDVTSATLRSQFKRMVEDGRAVRGADGRWRLTS